MNGRGKPFSVFPKAKLKRKPRKGPPNDGDRRFRDDIQEISRMILVEYTPSLLGGTLYWGSKGRAAPLGLLRVNAP